MAIDPICGMTVDPATAAGSLEYQGQRYYFCGLSCLDRFKADPERALQAQLIGSTKPTTRRPLPMMQPAPAATEAAAIDPVCGMTVQPSTAAGSYEYQGKTYYFCATSCLAKFRTDPIHYLTPPEQRAPASYRSHPVEWSNTSVRWIRRCLRLNQELAEFAGWRWNPKSSHSKMNGIPSSKT